MENDDDEGERRESETSFSASRLKVPRWTTEEDQKLREMMDEVRDGLAPSWTSVAEGLGTGRTAAACAQHWLVLSGRRGKRKTEVVDSTDAAGESVRHTPFHPAFPPRELVDGVVQPNAPTDVWLRRWAAQSPEMLGRWFASNVPTFDVFEASPREASLYELSAAEYINERASGRVTCVEYVQALMRRARFFAGLNCFTTVSMQLLSVSCGAQARSNASRVWSRATTPRGNMLKTQCLLFCPPCLLVSLRRLHSMPTRRGTACTPLRHSMGCPCQSR